MINSPPATTFFLFSLSSQCHSLPIRDLKSLKSLWLSERNCRLISQPNCMRRPKSPRTLYNPTEPGVLLKVISSAYDPETAPKLPYHIIVTRAASLITCLRNSYFMKYKFVHELSTVLYVNCQRYFFHEISAIFLMNINCISYEICQLHFSCHL